MKKILRNAIQCRHCGDIIESFTTDDFRRCSCKTCAVDGGHAYLRRCFANSPEEDFIDLSECEADPAPAGYSGAEKNK